MFLSKLYIFITCKLQKKLILEFAKYKNICTCIGAKSSNGDASKTFYSTFYNQQIYNWINIKVTKSQLVNLKICFECKKYCLLLLHQMNLKLSLHKSFSRVVYSLVIFCKCTHTLTHTYINTHTYKHTHTHTHVHTFYWAQNKTGFSSIAATQARP